jgi:hypothetical protein
MMDQQKTHPAAARAGAPIRVLSVTLFLFAALAAFGSIFLWGQGSIFSPPVDAALAFPIADLLVNVPASLTAAIGLWRMKRYGFVAAQIVAGIYLYASVEIFVDLWQHGANSTVEYYAILIPQVLAVIVAAALVLYLWRVKNLFFPSGS